MIKKHYHLYMDESGGFEGSERKIAGSHPALLVTLVSDENREILATKVKLLWLKHRIKDTHAMAKGETIKPAYLTDLIGLLEEYQVICFILRHEQDLQQALSEEMQEAFAVNRFLEMADTLLEHIFFLHPPFFCKTLQFSLHPNSRVCVLDDSNMAKIEQMRALGYDPRRNKDGRGRHFVIWDPPTLRTKVQHHALDYSPWISSTGARNFSKFETIVAERSDDPLVHMTDNLAYLCRSNVRGAMELQEVNSKLIRLSVCLDYGRSQRTYRELVRWYLAGDIDAFFPEALQILTNTTDRYYRDSLNFMLENSLGKITLAEINLVEKLEQLAAEYLRTSRGNWQFVLELLRRLIAAAITWPDQVLHSDQCKRLLFRLYSLKLSVHNHRGEDVDAWESYESIDRLDLGKLTIEEYREKIEVENRAAVTMSNLFAFEQGREKVSSLITTLEHSLHPLEALAGSLYDPLIGKLRGTMAQNVAFLAPRKPELFEQAESLFVAAAQEFTQERDKVRHDVNLLHLYLDWSKQHEAKEIVSILREYPSVAAFLERPTSETARYMQFVLSVFLKYGLENKAELNGWVELFPLASLKQWFGEAVEEHPFEFICASLGRIACSLNKELETIQYFDHALRIPLTDKPREQPTLQAIRAQIWVWWAMEENIAGRQPSATEKIVQAIKIMEDIGTTEGLETMLRIEPDGTATGWFAEGWQALNVVDWRKVFDRAACAEFLRCFTFNYR